MAYLCSLAAKRGVATPTLPLTHSAACRRLTELVMVSIFGLAVTEQYVSPTIVNSYGVFSQLNWLGMVERVFKLSIPVLWGWLIIFYTLFHLLLNITAEFTGFGDREFYLVCLPIATCCTDHGYTGELAAMRLTFHLLHPVPSAVGFPVIGEV